MALSTFSIVQRSLAETEEDPDHAGLPAEVILAGRVRKAVQTVVDCLVDPSGGKYVVSFADISTAATSLGQRQIVVSSKPLRDPSLTLVEKAVVIATFAAHEIGHTVVTKPRGTVVKDHNPKSGFHAVANVADDIILEPHMADEYPILADAFEFTGMWVLRNTRKGKTVEDGTWPTTAARFNSLLSATRYGDIDEIVFVNDKARSERDWGRDWARRLIALRLSDHGGFIALCDEAWVHIRTKDDDDTGEQPEPPVEPEDDEPESQPGESNPSDEDEDEDGEGESSESDEAEDDGDVEDGEDEGDGEPEESDEDGEGEGKSEPTDEGGAIKPPDSADFDDEPGEGDDDGDGDPSEDGTKPGDMTGDPESDSESGQGGGGAKDSENDVEPPDLRDEDDFDPKDVDQTTHEQAERSPDWDDKANEGHVNTYENTNRTAFPTHGAMTTTWS